MTTAAQTRADSVAIVRLVVSRALQDAKRQDERIRTLVFAPKSIVSSSRTTPVDVKLLALAPDSLVIRQDGAPVCPWYIGGQLEPRLEIALRSPKLSSTDATIEVFLGCSAGLTGRSPFGWGFTHRLERKGKTWIIAQVIERYIS